MSNKSNSTVATMGIDISKNAFHLFGLDRRGAIVLQQRWSRGQAWMGARYFLTRGLIRVRTEMSLHVLGQNLKRIISILGVDPLL